jgi:hypothetical protein
LPCHRLTPGSITAIVVLPFAISVILVETRKDLVLPIEFMLAGFTMLGIAVVLLNFVSIGFI